MTRERWCAALALALAPACGPSDDGAKASASALPPAPMLVGDAGPTYEEETSTRPLEVLKFQFTSEVKNREPVDVLSQVAPGKRVFAHLTVRNRTGRSRTIHLAFSVNGQARTTKDLPIDESWSWRTWAFNTVLPTDKPGKLDLEVTDDEGNALMEASLPIKP